MNVDNKNIIPKLSEKDTAQLTPVTVGRKFGRDDDRVEFHLFDVGGRHVFSRVPDH